MRFLLSLGVGVMFVVASTTSSAQLPAIPSWAGQLLSQMNGDVLTVNNQTLLTNSASTREELPRLGDSGGLTCPCAANLAVLFREYLYFRSKSGMRSLSQ